MKKIARFFKLYRSYLSLAFKSSLAYRADAIIAIIGFIISNIANFDVLYFMITPVSKITVNSNGVEMVWNLERLMFLYGFLLIPKGIDHMFSDDLWDLAGSKVTRGNLDVNLVKPVGVIFQIVASKFSISGCGEVLLGIAFIAIFGSGINPLIISANTIIPLILCGFLTIFIFFSIKLFCSSLAFWFKNTMSLTSMIYNLNGFVRYPIQIYGKVISSIFIFILPFGLGAFLPVQYFIFGGNMWLLTLVVFLITSLFLSIAVLTFNKGLHKYESAGS